MALLAQAAALPTEQSAASSSSAPSSPTPDSVWKRGFCWLCSSTSPSSSSSFSSGFHLSSSPLPSSSLSSVSSAAAAPVTSAQGSTREDDETSAGEFSKGSVRRRAEEAKLLPRADKRIRELKNAAHADTLLAGEMEKMNTPQSSEEKSFAATSGDVIELKRGKEGFLSHAGIEDVSAVEDSCPLPTVFVCLVLGLLLADGLQQLVKKRPPNVLSKFTSGLWKCFGFLLCTAWRFCRGCGVRTPGSPALEERRERTRTSGDQSGSQSEADKKEERHKREEEEEEEEKKKEEEGEMEQIASAGRSGNAVHQRGPPAARAAPGREGTETKKWQPRRGLSEQKDERQRKEETLSAAALREQLAALLQAQANTRTSLSSDFVFHTKLQRKILRVQQQLDALEVAEASIKSEKQKTEEVKAEGSLFETVAKQCMHKLLRKMRSAALKAFFCYGFVKTLQMMFARDKEDVLRSQEDTWLLLPMPFMWPFAAAGGPTVVRFGFWFSLLVARLALDFLYRSCSRTAAT